MPKENKITTSMTVSDHGFEFLASIASATEAADAEMLELHETIETVNRFKPECDKLDYALACCSGALCGIMDIFLVGKPGETPLGDRTDKWFTERTMDFARLCGWKDPEGGLSSAIRHLECRFKIPYDQTGLGGAAREVFDLSPSNHHLKSLGHNPTLLGLFFSILDQWRNSSHFVTGGDLISLQKADPGFELRGGSVPAKLFCGFVNWFGHLVSDVSGASGSKGRGMGIPSPFWAWINDLTVRLIYSVRRSIGYLTSTEKATRCFRDTKKRKQVRKRLLFSMTGILMLCGESPQGGSYRPTRKRLASFTL